MARFGSKSFPNSFAAKSLCCFFALLFSVLPLFSCKKNTPVTDSTEHEPITMQSPFRNMSAFIDILHEKYPEINLEVVPYSGANYTAYVQAQLKAGDMPDVYCTTTYVPDYNDVSDKLIDLSGYAFADCYTEARLRDVTSEDGAIYFLPTYYECIGITYNKTLLEKHGWTLPNSLRELRELAPKAAEAGCTLCLNQIQLPGFGFQYFCNIMDTVFLNTPDGKKWQRDYLSGKVKLSDSPVALESLKTLDTWRDLGMLNPGVSVSDGDTRLEMAKGNTLFMLGSNNVFEGKSEDEFGLMPYLSEDGTQNAFVLNVSRYMGLNKHLEDEGNEQKLADALHVMEVLSTVEGMQALNSLYTDTSLLPLKNYKISPTGYYADIEDQLNSGATAPFIYDGWTDVIVPIGETMLSYIRGESDLDDVVAAFDESQKLIGHAESLSYTTVTEKIDTEDCARLNGIIFAEAVGADLSLISVNKWYKTVEFDDLNLEGVSGALFPMPITDQEIVSVLTTGWRGNVKTVTLTGKRIRELAESGYDRNGDGNTYPYVLVMPDGMSLSDDTVYTVAVAGITEEVAEEGNLTDTGVLGLEAAREYFSRFDTFSKNDIQWSK